MAASFSLLFFMTSSVLLLILCVCVLECYRAGCSVFDCSPLSLSLSFLLAWWFFVNFKLFLLFFIIITVFFYDLILIVYMKFNVFNFCCCCCCIISVYLFFCRNCLIFKTFLFHTVARKFFFPFYVTRFSFYQLLFLSFGLRLLYISIWTEDF